MKLSWLNKILCRENFGDLIIILGIDHEEDIVGKPYVISRNPQSAPLNN